jgi:peptidoglycan hydrolase CwlO-like protein
MKQKELLLEKLSDELKQKDCLVESLKSEINTYKTEISKLNEDLESQRRKNNVSTERYDTAFKFNVLCGVGFFLGMKLPILDTVKP